MPCHNLIFLPSFGAFPTSIPPCPGTWHIEDGQRERPIMDHGVVGYSRELVPETQSVRFVRSDLLGERGLFDWVRNEGFGIRL